MRALKLLGLFVLCLILTLIFGSEKAKLLMVGSTVLSLVFNSIISRISAKLSLDINNDIQADIFDKIVDADWLSLSPMGFCITEDV